MSEYDESMRIPLFGIRARARCTPDMIRGSLEQTYVNVEDAPIEAVYSFPLPPGAVLLEVTCRIGGRILSAKVNAKSRAEERYEEAVAEGRSAMLLQEVSPGLYSASVGCLQPHEAAVLAFSYAQLPVWHGRSLRFHLPTVVAERYGDPADAGFAPWQAPEASIHAEYGFGLELELAEGLEACGVSSPTHEAAVSEGEGVKTVAIEGAVADRDCVVLIERPQDAPEPAPLEIVAEADGGGQICLARVHVPEDGREDPLNLEVVVDCSGSMSGDSIFQAKKGLRCLLEELRPRDRFNVTCFGSSTRSMEARTIPADSRGVSRALAFVAGIEADMGGTELVPALEAVARRSRASRGESDRTDILLLTDGEVWNARNQGRDLARAGCRVFSLGVGGAVAADVLQDLAGSTGGAVELAAPNEAMNQAVLRLFRSMRRFPETRCLAWPGEPEWIFPEAPVPCFGGDTLFFFARYAAPAQGRAEARGGEPAQASLPSPRPCGERSVLARLGAARLLEGVEDAARGEALALRYGLVSPWTSAVMVDESAEAARPGQVPELRKVPQMPAAGQFGAGSVLHCAAPSMAAAGFRAPVEDMCECLGPAPASAGRPKRRGLLARVKERILPGARTGAACRTCASPETGFDEPAAPEEAFRIKACRLSRLRKGIALSRSLPEDGRPDLATIKGLVGAGLPAAWAELLRSVAGGGWSEEDVAGVFLCLFCRAVGDELPAGLPEREGELLSRLGAVRDAILAGAASL